MTDKKTTIKHVQKSYSLKPEAIEFPMMCALSIIFVCNAQCPNCPYNNSDIRDKYQDALYMPEEIFKKIADECGPYGTVLRFSGGGEPMLHPQVVDFILYAKACGAKVGLITNGSNFTEEKLKMIIRAGIDAIEFSADAGNKETHERVRPGVGWETLNLNVEMAVNIRNQLESSTNIIVSVINQKGVDVKAAEKYWDTIVDNVQTRKYLTWGYNKDLSADSTPYLPPEDRIPCPWLFERINIDSRGDVTVCGEDIAYDEKFDNIKNKSIKDIWQGSQMTHMREMHLAGKGTEIAICAQCPDWKYRSWNYNYWNVLKDARERREKGIKT